MYTKLFPDLKTMKLFIKEKSVSARVIHVVERNCPNDDTEVASNMIHLS